VIRPRLASFALCAVAASCVTVAPTPGSPAPLNACSSQVQCTGYAQGGVTPTCLGGVCQIPPTLTNRWAVVSLSDTAPYAAGATFAIPYETLGSPGATPTCATTCPANATCAQLPPLATPVPSDLEVQPLAAMTAGWNLGNPGQNTALPVTVVLRPQVPAGLPLGPIQVNEGLNTGANPVPGPGGGPSLDFSIAVPPLGLYGYTYEQTLMPMSPWDQAVPPDVRIVTLGQAPYPEESVVYSCDPNQPPPDPRCTLFDPIAMGAGATYPTFDLSRADSGPLDGWVVFLRDQTTLRRISNEVTLSGTSQSGVQLLTSHHPPAGQGAFYNAALVMQPPPDSGLPTAIFAAVSGLLPSTETYPLLPKPMQVSGKVVTLSGGAPVPADVVFDVTANPAGLCRYVQSTAQFDLDPASDGDLSFTMTVPADDGTFTATLPWGVYRATARPHDTSTEVTVIPDFATASILPDTQCQGPASPGPIVVDVLRTVRGSAKVFDGRALAAATIEAIPTQCSIASSDASCLPRAGETTTALDGTYTLQLDPGIYTLRARPAEGSALPWQFTTLIVGSAAVTSAPQLMIPAPSNAGLVLQDFKCNPVVEGLVRMYETPTTGGAAIEIGEALTDATGHYDMYLAPPQ
jgi:hypothetical protein